MVVKQEKKISEVPLFSRRSHWRAEPDVPDMVLYGPKLGLWSFARVLCMIESSARRVSSEIFVKNGDGSSPWQDCVLVVLCPNGSLQAAGCMRFSAR